MDQHISSFDANTDDSSQQLNHSARPSLRLVL
jgi:hypothetical protein